MYEILTALYPKGALWEPKRFELGTAPGNDLITNGTFDTDLSGWTDYGSTGSGEQAGVYWSTGKAHFFYAAA
jgi:hypothetical protein